MLSLENKKETTEHHGVLSGLVTIVSLLIALIAGATSIKWLPPWAFWICVVGIFVVACVIAIPWVKTAKDRYCELRRRQRVKEKYHDQILGLIGGIKPLSELSCIYSVANAINSAMNFHLLDTRLANSYLMSVSILCNQTIELENLADSRSDVAVLRALHGWLQMYVRICEAFCDAVRANPALVALQPGQWDSFQKCWSDGREHATAQINAFKVIVQGVKVVDKESSVPEFLPQMPNIWR